MVAFYFKKHGEAVAAVVYRGHGSKVTVKSQDNALKAKLKRLYTSSFTGLSQNFDGSKCETKIITFVPGNEEHFRKLSREQDIHSDFQVEVEG